jgi:hypothetical protein
VKYISNITNLHPSWPPGQRGSGLLPAGVLGEGAGLGPGAWPPRRRLGAWTGARGWGLGPGRRGAAWSLDGDYRSAACPRGRVGRWVLGSWPPPPGKAGTRTTGTLGVAAAVGSGVGGRDGWEGKGVENLGS